MTALIATFSTVARPPYGRHDRRPAPAGRARCPSSIADHALGGRGHDRQAVGQAALVHAPRTRPRARRARARGTADRARGSRRRAASARGDLWVARQRSAARPHRGQPIELERRARRARTAPEPIAVQPDSPGRARRRPRAGTPPGPHRGQAAPRARAQRRFGHPRERQPLRLRGRLARRSTARRSPARRRASSAGNS